jgi:hypothetical protein
MALIAHGTLLLAFTWDSNWTDRLVKLPSIFVGQTDLPKTVEIKKQNIDPQLIVTDPSKPPPQSELASSQTKPLEDSVQAPAPPDKLELAAADSALKPEKSLQQQKMLEEHSRAEKPQEIKAQKIKAQLGREQIRKKELDLAQKKREKERQIESTHVQMKSKQTAENQKNINLQAKKETIAKKSADNLSEAYRLENIRRIQRMVGSN